MYLPAKNSLFKGELEQQQTVIKVLNLFLINSLTNSLKNEFIAHTNLNTHPIKWIDDRKKYRINKGTVC